MYVCGQYFTNVRRKDRNLYPHENYLLFYLLLLHRLGNCSSVLDDRQKHRDIEDDTYIYDKVDYNY